MNDAGLLQLDHLAALEAGNGSGRSTRCFRWNGIGPRRSIYGSCFSGEICCFMSDTTKPELNRRATILRELLGVCKDRHAYRKEAPDLFMDDEPLPNGYPNGALVDPYDDEFMYNELTVQETLAFHNAMRPDASENEQNVFRLVKIMRLNGVLSQPIATLTPDQRRCLTIAVELISGADVIIYDDFTSGLTSIQFADVLSNLKKMLVEYNPACIIILGVAQLSYDEIMYVDRIQVISNSNAGASRVCGVPTYAKQAGRGRGDGAAAGGGDNGDNSDDMDESYFNGSCSMIKAYIRRCRSDSYIYTDSSQNNSRDHDIGTSYDFISVDRTDTGNEVMDAIAYGRIVVISVELFRSRAWRLFIGRIDQTQGMAAPHKDAWLTNDPEPTRGTQSGRGGAGASPPSRSRALPPEGGCLVEAQVEPPSHTVSVDTASVDASMSYGFSDGDPVVSSPIMQHLLPISSAVKINVALPVSGSNSRGNNAGVLPGSAQRPLFGRDSFNAAARGSTNDRFTGTGAGAYSDDEDEEAMDLLTSSRGSMFVPINTSLGRPRLRWTFDLRADGRPGRWLARLATQLYWCCWRAIIIKIRNIGSVLFMWMYVGALLPVGVILTFSDLGYSQYGFTNRCALLTVMPFVMTLLLNLFFDQQKFDRNITAWDRNRGTHCPAFAMIANTAADLVVVKFIPPVIAAAVVYYPCNLKRTWPAFWAFTEALWVLCLTASCFSRLTYGHMAALSCRAKHLRSSMQFVGAMSVMLLYCGIIVYLPSVPSSSLFLKDWSLFYWGCNLLYYNDMGDAEFLVKGHGGGEDYITTGAHLLAQNGIEDLGRKRCLTNLLSQANAYLLLALALALLFYRDWSRRNCFSDAFHWLCDALAL